MFKIPSFAPLQTCRPRALELAEGARNRTPPDAARQALTDANAIAYHGPCPPIGKHRHFFHLAALDCALPELDRRARRADLERAMTGHVLATAVLMGTYARAGG